MKLVVIIPSLNEEKTIATVIKGVPTQITGIDEIEVVIINDGSSDKTATIAQSAGAIVINHPQNLGVGAAFHTGIKQALQRGADIIVNMDADGQFNPQDIPSLIQPILKNKAQFVTCTRFGRPDYSPTMPYIKKLGNLWMTNLINLITGQHFTDVSCGFRAYDREAALRLILFGRFTYTQESLIDLAFKRIPMTEVPLKVRGERSYGRSRVADNLLKYGIKSFSIIFRAARDYKPLIFFAIPGSVSLATGLGSGIFLLSHWLNTGQTYPYRSLVQLSSVLIVIGFLLIFIAMLADMMHRNRILLDNITYHIRKRAYDPRNHDHPDNF
jgi:glycosyltransferase involved in cell wall biosynthesis